MEADDILSDQVQVSRPEFLELLGTVAVAVITDTGNVVGQSIQPYVGNMLRIKGNRNTPVEGGSGYTQILKTRKKEVIHHLVLTGYRLNEFRMGVNVINQTIRIFAHFEEICFLFCRLYFTAAVRAFAISQLEQELGVQLFERKGRSSSLTSAGEQFLTYVNKSLAILDNGISAMEHISRGEGCIRLGFIRPLGTQFIPGLAADFLKTQNSVDICFEFHTDSSQPLLTALREGIYDMVFCTRMDQETSIDFFPVAHQDLVLIVPKGHPLSGLDSVDLSASLAYPHICFTPDSGLRSVVDQLFQKIGQSPEIAYEIQEDQVIAGLVAQNFGIAVVPYMDELPRMNLDIIQISRPLWERNFYLATLKNSRILRSTSPTSPLS